MPREAVEAIAAGKADVSFSLAFSIEGSTIPEPCQTELDPPGNFLPNPDIFTYHHRAAWFRVPPRLPKMPKSRLVCDLRS